MLTESNRKFVSIQPFNIAYRQWGERGKPIVLLHGIPMNSSLWQKTGEVLAKSGYKVFAPELLGLGYTEAPIEADHSLKGQAEMMKLFIDNVIRETCILVGHDMGGGVAQIMITEYKDIIEKCVLTNCVAFDAWPVEGIKTLSEFSHKEDGFEKISDMFIAGFLSKGLPAGVSDKSVITMELVKDILGGLTHTIQNKQHFMEFLKAMDNSYTQKAALKLADLDNPVLIVWAKDDPFQPLTVGERLNTAIPKCSLRLIQGGHFHPLENLNMAEVIIQCWS